ncbi:hypothetical protein AX769_10175 [Frondihabitans sp. PAMC 28766]|uniref:DsbA family protein n=1 Tax=Frondihabitans sp. PAMC 28766 TaxID=1795630 RepID=UPI00078E2AED|nr:thioredoxin domain-containing protein [Frondihabitans sp. PAMC 28766]AMM20448.1 hypothetical protein AX769_10175 [Frondihabitans sp. PAMC 28766]
MTPAPDNGQSKRNRRDEAREKARIAREAAARRRRRNRFFIIGGSVLAAIVVVAVVVFAVTSSIQPPGPGPKNMASGGILLQGTSGQVSTVKTAALKNGEAVKPTDQKKLTKTVNITAYIDYQCPYCDQFETTNAAQIQTLLKKGAITYEVHPIAFLDNSSLGNKYSTRSANAAACVANYEPDKFLAVTTAFYKNQPAEGTHGRTDQQIITTVKGAGATNSKIPSCITSQKFKSFVANVTQTDLTKKLPNSSIAKLSSTPTVIVNGKQYQGSLTDASAFSSFVAQQSAS